MKNSYRATLAEQQDLVRSVQTGNYHEGKSYKMLVDEFAVNERSIADIDRPL